MYYFVLGNIT